LIGKTKPSRNAKILINEAIANESNAKSLNDTIANESKQRRARFSV